MDGIVAMGQAYVAFTPDETAVFRLMFGQEPSLKKAEHVLGAAHACFAYCKRNKVRGDTRQIALRLWTFVNGAASLLIDRDYDAIAPNIDINQLIAGANPGLLAAAPSHAKH